MLDKQTRGTQKILEMYNHRLEIGAQVGSYLNLVLNGWSQLVALFGESMGRFGPPGALAVPACLLPCQEFHHDGLLFFRSHKPIIAFPSFHKLPQSCCFYLCNRKVTRTHTYIWDPKEQHYGKSAKCTNLVPSFLVVVGYKWIMMGLTSSMHKSTDGFNSLLEDGWKEEMKEGSD